MSHPSISDQWRIYVTDRNRNKLKRIRDWQAATLFPNDNAIGGHSLQVAFDNPAIAELDSDGAHILYSAINHDLDPDDPNYEVDVLSGPIGERLWTDGENEQHLIVAGPDDMTYLADRVARPEPVIRQTTTYKYATDPYDTNTDPASTVVWDFVDDNLGPSALAERVAVTMAADPAIGDTRTGQARWTPVSDVILPIAGGVDFTLSIINGQFEVRQRTDRTAQIRLSRANGNLTKAMFREAAPTANYLYMLGAGTDTDRLVVEVGDQPSVTRWWRREAPFDRRDLDTAALLIETAADELANAYNTGVNVEVPDLPSMRLGIHYRVGDRVTVEIAGHELEHEIRSVLVNLTNDPTTKIAVGHVPLLPTQTDRHRVDRIRAGLARLQGV